MATIDRTLPAELSELARLAITSGLDEVHLLFQGLGADFPAAIGWQLSITRTDPSYLMDVALDEAGLRDDPDELDWDRPAPERDAQIAAIREQIHQDNRLTVTAQVGTEVSAYIGGDGEDPYWNAAQIREWILGERPGIAPLDGADLAQAEHDADWMIDAYSRGWSMERVVDRGSAAAMAHVTGRATTNADLYVKYEASALNHFFNVEGHPAHRDNVTEVSYDIHLMRKGLSGPWIYCSDGLVPKTYQPKKLPVEEAMTTIAGTPPWHTEVAYFEEDADGGEGAWVR